MGNAAKQSFVFPALRAAATATGVGVEGAPVPAVAAAGAGGAQRHCSLPVLKARACGDPAAAPLLIPARRCRDCGDSSGRGVLD